MQAFYAIRDWSKWATKSLINAAIPIVKGAAKFAVENREAVIGGVGGYVAGKVIEQIPIVGKLLKPLPSLLLGGGGVILGRKEDIERRKIEALEKLNKT